MCPDPTQRDHRPQGPLTAGFDPTIGRLPQDGHVAGQEIRSLSPQLLEPALVAGHLLAAVEAPSDVHRELLQGAGQVEHHRQAALHVGRTDPPQHVAVGGDTRASGDHCVQMAGQDHSLGSTQVGTGDDIVRDPVDRQPLATLELGDDAGSQGLFVVAGRGDLHQLLGEGKQVGHAHVATPCSRRIALSWALS